MKKPAVQFYDGVYYLDAYAAHTDERVRDDPHKAIGGMWEAIGTVQFEFMKNAGLHPENSLLDVGCGTLRGGRLFIPYLDGSKYTGIDISNEAIAYARNMVEQSPELLEKKSRNIIQ